MAAALIGCSLVDEDMSDCESDVNIDYELRLVTNMSTELQTELSAAADVQAVTALRTYFKDVFTDFAHDVDLSFYDIEPDPQVQDAPLLHHESHIMDANQSSYTLYIPVRKYQHLAVANIENNPVISHTGGDLYHSAILRTMDKDTIPNLSTGLFTARLPINIIEGEDQEFHVKLYMANCATALLIDTTGMHVSGLRAYARGFADSFRICDSSYVYDRKQVIEASNVPVEGTKTICFTTISLPSQSPETRTVIEIEDPDDSQPSGDPFWAYSVYVTQTDGSITESLLTINKPLKAGQLKVLKAKLLDNGAVQPDDPTVGVSIRLDWNPGIDITVDL